MQIRWTSAERREGKCDTAVMFRRDSGFSRRIRGGVMGNHIKKKWNSCQGFTVMELLIVLVVMGLMAVLALPVFR